MKFNKIKKYNNRGEKSENNMANADIQGSRQSNPCLF